ncbi:MAG TPA: nucleoside triphosphate pyrophosphohydrolase [Gammaproteobacteria bacterium]|nr:nucleoside triphosphate pyrophosphohydrolase [Gammaproteobacteria bacterium]
MPDINKLLQIMTELRDTKSGCPWDIEQTFETIAPYTLEEAYEVADAIQRNNLQELKGELGDLLFQVVFHARLAEEAGAFDFSDVVTAICDKMVRRHPHVFADERVATVAEQSREWEQHKARERKSQQSAVSGVALALPALVRAKKLQSRAARVGFDWPDISGPLAKCHEELAEIEEALKQKDQQQIADEIGDLLFAVVNLARFADVDAEAALKGSSERFVTRFQFIERKLGEQDKITGDVSLEELEELWVLAKHAEKSMQDGE